MENCDEILNKEDYCHCDFDEKKGVHVIDCMFGYWYACDNCGKPIEGEYYYYDECIDVT